MQLTELTIKARHSWEEVGESNPLICTVKLSSEKARVETALSDADAQKMLDLIQGIVADAAKRNIDEFCAAVSQVEAQKGDIALHSSPVIIPVSPY